MIILRMSWLRAAMSWPRPILVATVLTVLSAVWMVLCSSPALGRLGMPVFQSVGTPMHLGVMLTMLILLVRLQWNRPESLVAAVPVPVRILVPAGVLLAVLQIFLRVPLMPLLSPGGDPVRSYNAEIGSGLCTVIYNGSERVTRPLDVCVDFQISVNRLFAAAWLLFSSIALWLAWAIYGAPAVQRVQPDRWRSPPALEGAAPGTSAVRATRPRLWLSLRLLAIVFWLAAGWRGGLGDMPVPAVVPVVAVLFGALSTRYGIIQAYTNVRRSEPWLAPSWLVNPFQRSQPFQFLHLGGLCFIAQSLSGVAHRAMTGHLPSFPQGPAEIFPCAFGLGLLLGLYWAVFAYRSRFQRVSAS